MTTVRPPIFDFDDAFFWEGATEQKLLIQRCGDCNTLRHPPTPLCAMCGSTNNQILTWIISQHPTEPDAEPRIVILVQLDEGTRIVSNLIDVVPTHDQILNDKRVEVCFVDYDGTVLPQFRLAGVQS
jgi:uncharacterized protein